MQTQTKTTDVGPVGLIPSGDYSPSASYSLLMTVFYKHDSWICVAMTDEGDAKEIIGIAPDDPTYGADNWQPMTDGGRAAVAVAAQVRTEFNEWFGATADSGIRKDVSEWFAAAKLAFTNWFGADADSGVRKIFKDFMALIKDTFYTWFGRDATEGVQKQWADLKEDATTVTGRASTAADVCEAWNTHPPYIADGTALHPGDVNYWYLYDTAASQYVKGAYAKGDDLDYDSMTPEEKQQLIDNIKADLVFASDETCQAAAGEIVFTPLT